MSAEAVESYAEVGLTLWVGRTDGHGPLCPDLICADVRAYLNWPDALTVFTLEEEQTA